MWFLILVICVIVYIFGFMHGASAKHKEMQGHNKLDNAYFLTKKKL